MGLGILEPSTTAHVPGTVLLNEIAAHSESQTRHLKHSTGKYSHIILDPQPSDDPNDPLNWSWLEKHSIWVFLCLGAIINGSTPGAMLQVGVGPISQDLGITFTDVAKLAGYQLVAAGASGPFLSALARKYGKRPAFVFASTMALIGCILGEVSTTYKSLIIARVFEGVGAAAYESLVMAAVGDIFFVHERGLRIAVLVFILSASGNLTLVIAGPITANLGWHYNFHILLPFVALQWLVLILFAPETTFIRAPTEHDEVLTTDHKATEIKEVPVTTHDETISHNYDSSHARNPESGEISGVSRRRKTFRQRLALYNGVFVQDSIFKMLIACPAILVNVGGAYNVFVSGLIMSWYVALAVIGTVIFSSPPYSYTATSVGYVCVAPLIGGLLGTVFAGSLTDPIARYMTRKNKGVYEPELRLPLISVGLITTLAGIYGFGYSAQNLQSVYVIAVNWAIALFGINVIVILSTAYPLDAFREHTTEIFVMNMMFKNLFNYGLTNYITDWYFLQGAAKMCNVLAGLTIASVITTIPMYIYGKRYRWFWHNHNLIRRWGLETDKTGAE